LEALACYIGPVDDHAAAGGFAVVVRLGCDALLHRFGLSGTDQAL